MFTAEIDYTYIGELVDRSASGDSDAFAELYAATCRKQYLFSCCYLNDANLAQDALQETYVRALKNLPALKDGKLFISWLNQINFRVCYGLAGKQARYNAPAGEETARAAALPESAVSVDGKEYMLQQVMALPFSESQVLFLRYCKNLKAGDIAYLMEIPRSTVRRYLKSGRQRLKKSPAR